MVWVLLFWFSFSLINLSFQYKIVAVMMQGFDHCRLSDPFYSGIHLRNVLAFPEHNEWEEILSVRGLKSCWPQHTLKELPVDEMSAGSWTLRLHWSSFQGFYTPPNLLFLCSIPLILHVVQTSIVFLFDGTSSFSFATQTVSWSFVYCADWTLLSSRKPYG